MGPPDGMKRVRLSVTLVAVLTAIAPLPEKAAELRPETLAAWEEHVKSADLRMQARVRPGHAFLWADEAPGRCQRLEKGEILVSPGTASGSLQVPGGLIHDWMGAAFIPGATLESVQKVAHDYDHYQDFYTPVVVNSKQLGCSPAEQQFSMLWVQRVLFVTAAVENQYRGRDFRVNDTRRYGTVESTRVQQVKAYGEAGEQRLPPDQGDGFIWRLYSIVRYEERDAGVYVELQAMVLSRDIPVSLRWLVKPVVTRLSRNSLVTSLQQTREAVMLSGTVRTALPNKSAVSVSSSFVGVGAR